MAITSLYLCNRTAYAAVGAGSGRGVKVSRVCSAELPEGCLINGVITNEAELAEALRGFFAEQKLPTRHVALAVGGSQFTHRVITLPAMAEKKRYAVLSREMTTGTEGGTPLDDYMVLHRDAKTRADTVLAVRVDKSLIDTYVALAKAAGFTLGCIDLGLAATIKAVGLNPDLLNETFVLLQFDGDNLYTALFEQGQYTYSTHNRLFNRRGTPESGTEIGQKLSGIMQFHATAKSEHSITRVYFSGQEDADLVVCAPGIETLGLTASPLPDCPRSARLPQGVRLCDCVFSVGNLAGRS